MLAAYWVILRLTSNSKEEDKEDIDVVCTLVVLAGISSLQSTIDLNCVSSCKSDSFEETHHQTEGHDDSTNTK